MNYSREDNPLAPHAYQHELVAPATYIALQQVKAHSTIFRVRNPYSTQQALDAARKRGFKPLYAVRVRSKKEG